MRFLASLTILCLIVGIFAEAADSGDGSWFGFQSDRPARRNTRAGATNNADGSGRPETVCVTNRKTCQNFDPDTVKIINVQINEELKASYVYQSMAFYYGRDDIALRGFSKFFQDSSNEEREHAQKLMDYLNKRGGTLILNDIPKPSQEEWGSGLSAMKEALRLEHHVNDKLLDLHWLAQQRNDPHLQDFLEGEYLTEQVDSIKQLSDFVSVLTRMETSPLGEYIFDQELYDGKR